MHRANQSYAQTRMQFTSFEEIHTIERLDIPRCIGMEEHVCRIIVCNVSVARDRWYPTNVAFNRTTLSRR